MLGRWLAGESRFDELLLPYRVHGDKVMLGMCCFLQLVCMTVGAFVQAWAVALAVGLPTLVLAALQVRFAAGALTTRLFMGCAFMAYTAVLIQQSGGQIEAHFSAFGLIAVLLYYRDWRPIAAATVFIYLHHMVLGYVQTRGLPVYVFDSPAFSVYLGKFLIHVAYFLPFVGMLGYLAVMLRHEGASNRAVIVAAQRVIRGNLVDPEPVDASLMSQHELPAAVFGMRQRLMGLLHALPVPILIVRLDSGSVADANDAFCRHFGFARESLLRVALAEMPVWEDPQHVGSLLRLAGAPNEGESGHTAPPMRRVELSMRNAQAGRCICEITPFVHEGGSPRMLLLGFEDVTQRRDAERHMLKLAYSDLLTGLPNRARLTEAVGYAWEQWRALGTPCALLMLDLDDFKPINDRFGHEVGDRVLVEIGQRLDACVRGSDIAARLGGDEFVVLLHGCATPERAERIALQMVAALSAPLALPADGVWRVGASVGVTHSGLGAAGVDELFRQADAAMYRAKAAGKNSVRTHDAEQPAPLASGGLPGSAPARRAAMATATGGA